MKRIAVLGALAVLGAALVTPAVTPAKKSQRNIVQVASRSDDFDTLVKLVKAAGLVGTLSGKTKYTVFAPTDAAFAKVPKVDARRPGQGQGEAARGPALPRRRGQRPGLEGRDAGHREDGCRAPPSTSTCRATPSTSTRRRCSRPTSARGTASSTSSTRSSSRDPDGVRPGSRGRVAAHVVGQHPHEPGQPAVLPRQAALTLGAGVLEQHGDQRELVGAAERGGVRLARLEQPRRPARRSGTRPPRAGSMSSRFDPSRAARKRFSSSTSGAPISSAGA